MTLTRISVDDEIEVSFGDRRVDKYTMAEVLMMRDGKDLEAKMKERQKFTADHTFTLSRTILGDIEVTATYTKKKSEDAMNILSLPDGCDPQVISMPTFPYRTLGQYGVVDDPTLTIDQTAKIQACVDDGAGLILAEKGRFAFTKLVLNEGVSFIGSGIGPRHDGQYGTYLQQMDGVNDDAITLAKGPGVYQHWGQLSNVRVQKAAGSRDTKGSGIKTTGIVGEGMTFDRVFVTGFPEDGIWFAEGGVPLRASNLHLFANGRYGVHIGTPGVDKILTAVYIDTVSGDANGLALVGLTRIFRFTNYVLINHIKSEGKNPAPNAQNDCIHIIDCDTTIEFHGVSHAGSSVGEDPSDPEQVMIRIRGPKTPNIMVSSPRGSLLDYFLVDEQTPYTQGWSNNRLRYIYSRFRKVVEDINPTS